MIPLGKGHCDSCSFFHDHRLSSLNVPVKVRSASTYIAVHHIRIIYRLAFVTIEFREIWEFY